MRIETLNFSNCIKENIDKFIFKFISFYIYYIFIHYIYIFILSVRLQV